MQRPPVTTIHEHRLFLLALARRLGGGRLDPEDLTQDVLERWLRRAPDVGNPRGWMLVVLRHLVVDRLRRRRTRGVILSDAADRVAAEIETAPWWHELDAGAVERELAHLPPALRATFRMFAFEARSYRQIADDQHIARATVGVRISRARALLRRRMTERAGRRAAMR